MAEDRSTADEKRFTEALVAADRVLGELGGIALAAMATETEPEVSEEIVTRLWAHAATTILTLAALHNDTPRTIANDIFEKLIGDEEHRADMERVVERLRRRERGERDD